MKKSNESNEEFNKKKYLDYLKFILLVGLIGIFSVFPYLNAKNIYAHDLGYHLNRIMSLAENIKIGQVPSMIHSRLLGGLGYANPLFYSELFMFIPALILIITKLHVLTVYKIFVILLSMATFLSMYIVTKKIFKNNLVAFLAGILYTFSLYRITDIYIRAALGELFTFIFLPIVTYGFYDIVFNKEDKWWILSLGIAGIAYSHLLSFVLIIIYLIILSLTCVDLIIKDKNILKNLVIAAIIAIILTIGFFGPMLEQKLNYTFYVDSNIVDAPEVLKERAIGLTMLLSNKVVGGYATNPDVDEGCMSEGIGLTLIIFASLFLFRKKIFSKENRFELTLFAIGTIFFIMTTKIFPWEKFSVINIIQFPFRLNIFPCFIYALIGAESFNILINNNEDFLKVTCILLMIFNGYILDNVDINFNPSRFYSFETLVEGVDQEIASKEYLPEGCDLEDLNDKTLYNINDKENKISFTQYGNKIAFEYKENDNDFEINVPLLYYKGYSANIEKSDGTLVDLKVTRNEENGFVLLKGEKDLFGQVLVEYKLTCIQIVSYIITVISVVAVIAYIVYYYKVILLRKKDN